MIQLKGPSAQPKSGHKAKQLVILLHGLGADGNDLFGLVPYFADALPDAYFISPDAPHACDMSPFGRQWFSLMDRSEEAILKGVQAVEPILDRFLDQKKEEFGLEDKDIALIGFSQGSMLSMHAALRRTKPLAAVLAYSGALVAPQLLKTQLKSRPLMCLVHGEADEIVPFEAFGDALAALQGANVPVQGYSQEGLGHGIDPAGLKIGMAFLKEAFGLGDRV